MSFRCRRRCDPILFIDSILPFRPVSPSPSSSSPLNRLVLIGQMIREHEIVIFQLTLAFYCGHVRHFRTCASQINNTIQIVNSIRSECARANSPNPFRVYFISSCFLSFAGRLLLLSSSPRCHLSPDARDAVLTGHRDRFQWNR